MPYKTGELRRRFSCTGRRSVLEMTLLVNKVCVNEWSLW